VKKKCAKVFQILKNNRSSNLHLAIVENTKTTGNITLEEAMSSSNNYQNFTLAHRAATCRGRRRVCMPMPLEDPLAHLRILTIKQVCELTTYTPQHIYRLERCGRFPRRVRIGLNRVGWRLADIEAWLASRETVMPKTDEDSGAPLQPQPGLRRDPKDRGQPPAAR
jgi:prophage regulatory protein